MSDATTKHNRRMIQIRPVFPSQKTLRLDAVSGPPNLRGYSTTTTTMTTIVLKVPTSKLIVILIRVLAVMPLLVFIKLRTLAPVLVLLEEPDTEPDTGTESNYWY